MMRQNHSWLGAVAIGTMLALLSAASAAQVQSDALPSWNDGPAKQAIVDFVRATTDAASPQFVPPEERIATFDQDGTLWVEHPMYTQVIYCLERVPALVREKPELENVEPFRTVLSGDREAIARLTMPDLEKILAATLSGMTTEEFQAEVKQWLATAKDPRWKRPYTELTYQPMQEVLAYLRANGYKTYIVTGGGQDFVRVYAEQTYGIPPEQVVGTAGGTKYGYDKDGRPVLTKEPKLLLNDDKAGKPEGIYLMIGRRPAAAFGNSDRRPADARIHQGRRRRAAGDAGAPRRRGARIRLRPGARIAGHQDRHVHPGALRRGADGRLDRHQYEEGLEEGIRVREVITTPDQPAGEDGTECSSSCQYRQGKEDRMDTS